MAMPIHDVTTSTYVYSSPSILQPSVLRPPLIIRLDLVPKANFLYEMTFILRPPAI